MGSIAMEAWLNQYANSCCRASSDLKLSASTRINPVEPTRATRELEAPACSWPNANGKKVKIEIKTKTGSATLFLFMQPPYLARWMQGDDAQTDAAIPCEWKSCFRNKRANFRRRFRSKEIAERSVTGIRIDSYLPRQGRHP